MKTFVHDIDIRREGIEIGKEIGMSYGQDKKLISQICLKLRKGKTIETISEELEEDIHKISHIYSVAKNFVPDYDENKVLKKYLEMKV